MQQLWPHLSRGSPWPPCRCGCRHFLSKWYGPVIEMRQWACIFQNLLSLPWSVQQPAPFLVSTGRWYQRVNPWRQPHVVQRRNHAQWSLQRLWWRYGQPLTKSLQHLWTLPRWCSFYLCWRSHWPSLKRTWHPMETSKTISFRLIISYLGFIWDLNTCTVAISVERKFKYINMIEEWERKLSHALAEVQKLLRNLMRAKWGLCDMRDELMHEHQNKHTHTHNLNTHFLTTVANKQTH